jgi:hypothetical protein
MVLTSFARAALAFVTINPGSSSPMLIDEETLDVEESDTVCNSGKLP